jgi:hypothetical protein
MSGSDTPETRPAGATVHSTWAGPMASSGSKPSNSSTPARQGPAGRGGASGVPVVAVAVAVVLSSVTPAGVPLGVAVRNDTSLTNPAIAGPCRFASSPTLGSFPGGGAGNTRRMPNRKSTEVSSKSATDERLADPDLEGFLEEEATGQVPDDERVVPEDQNEIISEDEGEHDHM